MGIASDLRAAGKWAYVNRAYFHPSVWFRKRYILPAAFAGLLVTGALSDRNEAPAGQPGAPAETAVKTKTIPNDVYVAYTPKGYPKTFKTWGVKGVARIQKLREDAAEAANKSPQCDAVEMVELSDQRSAPPKTPVVFVDCKNGERFYVSEKQLGAKLETEKELDAQAEKAADGYNRICEDQVRARLQRPMSFDRSILSTNEYRTADNGYFIEFEFEAKNGFGNVVPGHGECHFRSDGTVEISVKD